MKKAIKVGRRYIQVQPRDRLPAGKKWLLCLGLCAVISPATADPQVANPQVSETAASKPAIQTIPLPAASVTNSPDLLHEPQLAVCTSMSVKGQPLAECLQAMTQATGVHLTAAADIGQRRVNIFVKKMPLKKLMGAIARVTNLSWRVNDPASPGDQPSAAQGHSFELYQSKSQKELENSLMRQSELRQEWAQNAKRDALLEAVQKYLAQSDPNSASLAPLVAGLTPDQLGRAADLAAQPEGVISAGDNSYLANRVLATESFAEMPSELQSCVGTLLNNPAYGPNSQAGMNLAGPGGPDQLAQSQIGIVAADGSIRLAVIHPDGNIWVSPFDAITRKGIPGVDSDDGMDPEVDEAIANTYLVSLSRMALATRNHRLRFPANLQRTYLSDVLESVAKQTGLPIVTDDLIRSRETPYSWLLTDRDEYSLSNALDQIMRAFGHKVVFRDDVLCVQTISPGLDLRTEPPAEILGRLRKLTRTHQPLKLSDYLALANLTDLQFDALSTHSLPGIDQWPALSTVRRLGSVLRLYAQLSSIQQTQADSTDGLRTSHLTDKQYTLYSAMIDEGEFEHRHQTDPISPGRIYVARSKTAHAEVVDFTLTSEAVPVQATRYELSMPRAISPVGSRAFPGQNGESRQGRH